MAVIEKDKKTWTRKADSEAPLVTGSELSSDLIYGCEAHQKVKTGSCAAVHVDNEAATVWQWTR